MDIKQKLVNDLISLSQELGRTATCFEFTSRFGHKFKAAFGNYNTLVLAAGLDINKEVKKITNKIFEIKVEDQIEQYIPKESPIRVPYATLATISDIHWPFENKKVVNSYLEYVGDTKPEWCILNGDAWDFYSHSKFPRSHNLFTPRDEETTSRQRNEEFWIEVIKRSPKSQCVQMLGNHDIRPMKRVLEEYPEAEDWIKERLKRMFTFDGVKTVFDPREELMIGDIAVFHGYRSKLGDHRDYTLYNTINGHTHNGGCVYRRIRGQTLWELNSGLAGDPEAKGLTYTPQRITNWTPGFGIVTKHGPQFIPL